MVIFNATAAQIIRFAFGALFLFSSILKLRDMKGFYVIFLQYGILKGKIAKMGAYLLAFGELVIGIGLISGFIMELFSGLLLLFLIMSTGSISYVLYNKKKLANCGCYGTAIKVPVNKKKLLENIILLLLALYLFLFFVFI